MKILILNHSERLSPRVALEAETLKEAGHKITIINWDRNPGESKELETEQHNCLVKRASAKSPKGQLKILFVMPKLYKQVWKRIKNENFDVIHCTHFILLPITVFAAKRKNAKTIYDAYERYSTDFLVYFPYLKKIIQRTIEMIESLFVKQVDGVLTIDSQNQALKKRYSLTNENVEVLFNVPKLMPDVGNNELEELKDKYANNELIIYVGYFGEDKGLFIMLDVLKKIKREFPKIKLFLIGTFGSYEEKRKTYLKIGQYNLEQNVKLISWIPYNNMFKYLKISKIALALHQPGERFKLIGKRTGRKFFTYMQAGLPIVATDFGEIAGVVKEEECGLLVDATSPDSISNAIVYLLRNENIAKKMGENGRKAVEEKYNWDNEAMKLLSLYENLIDVPPEKGVG